MQTSHSTHRHKLLWKLQYNTKKNYKKVHVKMLSAKCQPFPSGLMWEEQMLIFLTCFQSNQRSPNSGRNIFIMMLVCYELWNYIFCRINVCGELFTLKLSSVILMAAAKLVKSYENMNAWLVWVLYVGKNSGERGWQATSYCATFHYVEIMVRGCCVKLNKGVSLKIIT